MTAIHVARTGFQRFTSAGAVARQLPPIHAYRGRRSEPEGGYDDEQTNDEIHDRDGRPGGCGRRCFGADDDSLDSVRVPRRGSGDGAGNIPYRFLTTEWRAALPSFERALRRVDSAVGEGSGRSAEGMGSGGEPQNVVRVH